MDLLASSSHLKYYEFVYGTSNITQVKLAMLEEEKRHRRSSRRQKRRPFADCSDISSLLSSTRSLLSRSLDRSAESTLHGSQETSFSIRTSSKFSTDEEGEKDNVNSLKQSKHRKSLSDSSSAAASDTKHTFDVTAEIHTESHKSTKTSRKNVKNSSDSTEPVNLVKKKRVSKGIAAVHGSPYKKKLAQSVPVSSTSDSSTRHRKKSKAPQQYVDPIVQTYVWKYCVQDSPPSPAPDSPVKSQPINDSKDNYKTRGGTLYENPLYNRYIDERVNFPLLDQPGCSWHYDQAHSRTSGHQYPVARENSDDDNSEDSSLPYYIQINKTDRRRREQNLNAQQYFEQYFIEQPLGELSLAGAPQRKESRWEQFNPQPERGSRVSRHRTLSRNSELKVVPDNDPVTRFPRLHVSKQDCYEHLHHTLLYTPEVGSPEPRLYELPKVHFIRTAEERCFLERPLAPRFNLPGSRFNLERIQNNAHMGRMNPLEDHERKVIIEFCHLLEKSKQLFNGLRELPQYGHKQWHSYFGRTFDVYTKLWKFQQQHRALLDNNYGLKRWQIGEIASKIGQLYYHFYLRTSETAYLNEAYSFYYAIRGRSYYTKASKEDKCELMVKKLRYYARFIVVCLLLKKLKLVRELIRELDRQIVEYGNTYDPDDQMEWSVVVDEVKGFIQAEPVVTVIHPDSYPMILSHRLSPLTTPPVERSAQMTLSLQEVLIVGSCSRQVKFSELTIDMYRMLQTVEREPTGDIQHMYDDSPRQRFISTPSAPKAYNLENGRRSDNPHKYLLFKPSPNQILVYLASGCNELPHNGALLLYMSADGQTVQPKNPEDVAYDIGGLMTTSKNDIYRECNKDIKNASSKYKEPQCLHPGDLFPFTRRPLFIIVDSDNSYVFQNIPRHFGQPLVVLMSPLEIPPSLNVSADCRNQGSLFTLFLHSPLGALCLVCDVDTISLVHWDRAQAYVDTFMAEASQILTRSRIDAMYISFMGDEFLRVLTLRFIFCEVTLRLHRAFRARSHLTRSSPQIPDELFDHPALTHIIMDLAGHLQVRGHFHDAPGAGPLPPRE